jgi:hypothetical protein
MFFFTAAAQRETIMPSDSPHQATGKLSPSQRPTRYFPSATAWHGAITGPIHQASCRKAMDGSSISAAGPAPGCIRWAWQENAAPYFKGTSKNCFFHFYTNEEKQFLPIKCPQGNIKKRFLEVSLNYRTELLKALFPLPDFLHDHAYMRVFAPGGTKIKILFIKALPCAFWPAGFSFRVYGAAIKITKCIGPD